MSHNDFVLPGNTWNAATVFAPELLAELDRKATSSVNGDEGGRWDPANPIWIGNAGVRLEKARAGRELRVERRGSIRLTDVYPAFATPLRRKVLVPLPRAYSITDTGPLFRVFNEDFFAVQSAVPDASAFGVPLTRWMLDRATLVSAALTMRAVVQVSTTSELPLPRFGIWRSNIDDSIGADDTTMQPFTTTLGLELTAPFPTTNDEYFNAGKPYALHWTTSQNNVIDLSTYIYTLVVMEARSTNGLVANNVYHSLELTFDLYDCGYG